MLGSLSTPALDSVPFVPEIFQQLGKVITRLAPTGLKAVDFSKAMPIVFSNKQLQLCLSGLALRVRRPGIEWKNGTKQSPKNGEK